MNKDACFMMKNKPINANIIDFWEWAYSDFTNNITRSVLAEYIVALSLDIKNMESEKHRIIWRPYDLMTKNGLRIEVKSAAYVQSWESKHPTHISFRIAQARLPDETGDFKSDSPLQRNSDVYIFCIYTAMSKDQSPFNLELWDFYVLETSILDKEKGDQKTITMPSLLKLNPIKCNYSNLGNIINSIKV